MSDVSILSISVDFQGHYWMQQDGSWKRQGFVLIIKVNQHEFKVDRLGYIRRTEVWFDDRRKLFI